jgi:hypothetical protein
MRMKKYLIHCLDSPGQVAFFCELPCRDDLDALTLCERGFQQCPVEIWHEDRLVARVKAGNAPLTSEDRQCL